MPLGLRMVLSSEQNDILFLYLPSLTLILQQYLYVVNISIRSFTLYLPYPITQI